MNRDEPMPIENEEARTTQRVSTGNEDLAREPATAHGDNGHDQPVEEPRMTEAPMGAERESRDQEDPTHVEAMSPSELTGYHDRFADLQALFIDDPKGATDQAGSLLKEAVDRLMESMSKGGDTELMRVGMQRYRHALETILDPTAV